jgi:3-hydroxyisobutyrate dehydrogenase-like beta-hydroxyacid dehydrogenase
MQTNSIQSTPSDSQGSGKAAIVGLGIIGSQWAQHLETDGILGSTWNRTPKNFARFTGDLREVPKAAQIIHVVVSDESAVLETISTFSGELTNNHIVIQSTTIDPSTSSTLQKMVQTTGAYYVEAPFTGSLPAAEQRKTVFFLGTEESYRIRRKEDFKKSHQYETVRTYLDHLSSTVFDIGRNEQACVIKLSMNLLIAAQMVALSEAYSTCLTHNIDRDVFFDVLKANAAWSGVAQLKEPKLRAEDFSPQFSIKHMQKDMRLLGTVVHNLDLHDTVLQYLTRTMDDGMGDDDISTMFKFIENRKYTGST